MRAFFQKSGCKEMLAIFLLSFFWASTFGITKLLLEKAGALSLAAVRFWIGSSVLILVNILTKKRKSIWKEKIQSGDKPLFIFVTACLVLHYLFSNLASTQINNTESMALSSFQCVLMLLVASLLLNELITPVISLCVALSGIGAVLTMEINAFDGKMLSGYIMMLLATLCWVLYCAYLPKLLKRYSILNLMTKQCLIAAVAYSPAFLLEENHWNQIGTLDIAALLYLSVICVALCFVLNAYGLKYMGSVRVSVLITIGPGVLVLLNILMHHTVVRPLGLVGLGFILTGVDMAVYDQLKNKENSL